VVHPVRALSAVLVSIAAATALAVPASAMLDAHPDAHPGAEGIGDPYFPKDGNGGYDVVHYGIHDTYRIKSGRLTGRTDIEAVATQNLSRFDLDLMLTPDKVTIHGVAVHFMKPTKHELVVTPTQGIRRGAHFTVQVRYHGVPADLGLHDAWPWNSNRHEAMAINEPDIAPWWFPANDHPSDKARFDITVRAARGDQVVSNGSLVSKHLGTTWSRWHWRMRQPMTTYLAFFAAGKFEIASGTSDGLPYTIAVSKRFKQPYRHKAMRLLRRSPSIVRWLAGEFGPYPFSSTGGVMTSLNTGFALENQSRPTYPYLGTGHGAHSTVVHELAHQWFGDDVSVGRWRDIWLNEGFASFVEWKYDETHGGEGAQTRLTDVYNRVGADRSFWRLRVANPGPNKLFNLPVYKRGAMALQALRHRIGDSDFSALLRHWVRAHAGGNARIPEFQRLAERLSGQHLSGFFDAWLHAGKKPARTAANGLR
jgi:aminopeptidase N